MATYSIEGPDGKTYSIDGPAGATRDQVIEQIKSRLGQQQTAEPAAPAAEPEPGSQTSAAGEFAKGVARGAPGAAGTLLGIGQDLATGRYPRQIVGDIVNKLRGKPVDWDFTPTNYGEKFIEKTGQAIGHDIEPNANATTTQAVAGNVGETLGNPLSWLGPENLVIKGLSAIGAGVGSELLGEAGDVVGLGTAGRILGGAAGGTVPGSAVRSVTQKETLQDRALGSPGRWTDAKKLYDEAQIKAKANQGYDWLRDPANVVQVPPQGIAGMYSRIQTKLHDADADAITAPKTFALVDKWLRPGQAQMGDSRDVLGLHNKLGEIRPTAENAADARAANIVRSHLREELANNLPGKAGSTLKRAMANWSHYKMIEDVRTALEVGEHRAMSSGTNKNAINTMRQEIRKILDSEARVSGFPQEAKDGMEVVISGTLLENFSRWVAKVLPYSPGLSILTSLWHSPVAPWLGAAAATQFGARKLGDFLTKGQIEKLITILRQQAPANKYKMGQNRALLQKVAPYSRAGAARGAVTGGMTGHETGTDTGEALLGDIGNFAQGGLYGVAKGRGYSSPAADAVASFVNSRGMNDAMVGMAIPTNVLHDLLVVQKMTYQQAADALGVTRQAVAGKAFREGLASGRQQGQQTAEGIERLRQAARDNKLASRGGQANAKKVALTAEQRELEARIQRVHDAISRARPQGERPQPSLPRLKFMEGPGPEDLDVSDVLENAPDVEGGREGIPRITVHPRD